MLRWEFRPGSTLFLAWTHSRSGYVPGDGSFGLGRDLENLFSDPPTNVVMLKLSRWLSP